MNIPTPAVVAFAAVLLVVWWNEDDIDAQAQPRHDLCPNVTPEETAFVFVGCVKNSSSSDSPLFTFHRCLQYAEAELCTPEGGQ